MKQHGLKIAVLTLCLQNSCALWTTRPVQELSDATAAINAAREVNAHTLTPELYREALEWFFKAKNAFQYKDFYEAKMYARKAKLFAEQAEFQSVVDSGGKRRALDVPPDPLATIEEEEKKKMALPVTRDSVDTSPVPAQPKFMTNKKPEAPVETP